MKFLVDQPVSPLLANWLKDRGLDAIHVRDRSLSSATDAALIELAIVESRVLITSDLDFPRIIALSEKDRPGVILFRPGNLTDQQMLDLLKRVMTEVQMELLSKSVVVVDEFAIRIASLPLRRSDNRA